MITYTENNVRVETEGNGEYTIALGDIEIVLSKEQYKSIASSFEHIMEIERAMGV